MATGTVQPRSPKLPQALSDALDEKLRNLRNDIALRADELANPDNSVTPKAIDIEDVAAAIGDLVRGSGRFAPTRVERFFEIFSPFTCVCALLCLAFAWLGFYSLSPSGSNLKQAAEPFLDIAKIFAGAIVGSTSTAIVARRRK